MTKVTSAVDARRNLGQLLNTVSLTQEDVIIERAGKPIARLTSCEARHTRYFASVGAPEPVAARNRRRLLMASHIRGSGEGSADAPWLGDRCICLTYARPGLYWTTGGTRL